MKTIDLSMYDTTDLTTEEVSSIDGGNPWAVFAVTFIVLQVVTNPRASYDAFMQGFNEGFNAVNVCQE